jgi:hypothetical protein
VSAGTQVQGSSASWKATARPGAQLATGEPSLETSAAAGVSKPGRRASATSESSTIAKVPVTTPAPFDLPVPAMPAPIVPFPSAQGLHLPGEFATPQEANSESRTLASISTTETTAVEIANQSVTDGSPFGRMPKHSSAPHSDPTADTASRIQIGSKSGEPGNDSPLHASAFSGEEQDTSSDLTGSLANIPTIS